MADDNNQRPYRTNDTRAPSSGSPSGNDPLAELARLIGQSDPFAEFGRDNSRRAAPAAQPAAPNWPPSQPAAAPEPRPAAPNLFGQSPATQPEQAQPYGAPNYEQPRYDNSTFAGAAGLYRTSNEAPAYAGANGQGEAYAGDDYYQDEQFAAEGEDVYDDTQPPRRRAGILVIAGVFALAVIGTAGAFGYRALFGSSGAHAPPPVIKAETKPIKVVPSAASKDTKSKQITERLGEGQGEQLVPREEQPVDIKTATSAPMQTGEPSAPLAPANGSGIVSSEPKKVHTIVIRPDQVGTNDAGGAAAPPPAIATAPPMKPAPAPQARPINPPAIAESAPAATPEPRPAAPRPAPAPAPARHAVASNNAPLSLAPGGEAPAPAPRAPAPPPPARAAAPASAPAVSGGGGYAVQVSAQRSEAEAQAAFRGLQAKYPSQLGSRQPMIRRVDLGAKGIYFRALIGPFANSAEASNVCNSLKSAGGQCIIQRI